MAALSIPLNNFSLAFSWCNFALKETKSDSSTRKGLINTGSCLSEKASQILVLEVGGFGAGLASLSRKTAIAAETQQKTSNAILRAILDEERTPPPVTNSGQSHQDAKGLNSSKRNSRTKNIKTSKLSMKNNQRIQQQNKYQKWLLMTKWNKARKIHEITPKSMPSHGT